MPPPLYASTIAPASSRCIGRSSYAGCARLSGPPGASAPSTAAASRASYSCAGGGSTTTYSSRAPLSVIASPTPSAYSSAAISRSAPDGSSTPVGWLWITSIPGSAVRAAASTARRFPRATACASCTSPASPTRARKHTSLPRARAISAQIRSAASGVR